MDQTDVDLHAELATLTAERDEAFAREKAVAEVLEVINASADEPARVFDAMLEKAMALCGAAFGQLDIYDGEHFRTTSLRSVPEAFAEFRQNNPPRYGPGTVPARILAGEAVVQVPDLLEGDVYGSGEPNRRAVVDLTGARAVLAVALRQKDKLLGFINIFRRTVGPFSDKQVALLQSFAAQVVTAMENARLSTELSRRTTELQKLLEYQAATSDVLSIISSSTLDLNTILTTLVDSAARLCHADRARIFRREGDVVRGVASSTGYDPKLSVVVDNVGLPVDRRSLIGRVALEERIVHLPDAWNDPDASPEMSQYRRSNDARTMLGVPMKREGKLIGVIVVTRSRVESFSQQEVDLVTVFADQAVIATENARLLDELRARTEEIADWNRELEARVAAQLGELERVGKLKRFLAPQLAELIVARGDEGILETHRRDIVVVFCDLRSFTAFAETAEPEEVLELLREYHGALGPIVSASEGTLDHFSGDGIMVFFNDPVPMPDASERAVRMAMAMREAVAGLEARWRRQGREIGFGVGIAHGYATLGQIGFADRIDYTAIGTVCNLAARLCAEAKDGQILVSRRVAAAVEENIKLEEIGELALKGLRQAVRVYNVAHDDLKSQPLDETPRRS